MNLRVLIINECESFCTQVAGVVAAEGHRSLCARPGREASRKAMELKPDLIVVELSGVGVGAVEMIQRLQRLEETGRVPMIVIADHPDLEFELLNVFDFLPKPLDEARLREDLRMLHQGRTGPTDPFRIEPFTSTHHQLFYDYLITHSGLHFERRNQKILEKGLTARMAALRIRSYQEYFHYLTHHHRQREELQRLLPFLTVGETYFFRYHAHFDALRKFLATEVAGGPKRRIRLWSAGCSTGEEPYSLAMIIMEAIPDWRDWDIRVLATDINNRSLKKAREGVYSAWAMRVIEQKYIDRHFDKIGKSYLVREEVKSLVDFSHLNLQTDIFPSPDSEFRDIDAVFCRNVMIYFSLPTTRKVVEKLASSLKPGGLLFLGHAETLFQISSRFERHSHGGGFYYRERKGKPAPIRPVDVPPVPARQPSGPPVRSPAAIRKPRVAAAPVSRAKMPAPAPSEKPLEVNELFLQAQVLFEAEKFEEASTILSRILAREPSHTGALVVQAFILANNGRFQEALVLCQQALDVDDLLPEAYFLKGMVLDMTDCAVGAMEEYRKAILLRMEFVMAHYYLGRLYFRTGKQTEGSRELRNTLKVLEKGQKEKVIPFSGGLSREVFIQQVRNELAKVA